MTDTSSRVAIYFNKTSSFANATLTVYTSKGGGTVSSRTCTIGNLDAVPNNNYNVTTGVSATSDTDICFFTTRYPTVYMFSQTSITRSLSGISSAGGTRRYYVSQNNATTTLWTGAGGRSDNGYPLDWLFPNGAGSYQIYIVNNASYAVTCNIFCNDYTHGSFGTPSNIPFFPLTQSQSQLYQIYIGNGGVTDMEEISDTISLYEVYILSSTNLNARVYTDDETPITDITLYDKDAFTVAISNVPIATLEPTQTAPTAALYIGQPFDITYNAGTVPAPIDTNWVVHANGSSALSPYNYTIPTGNNRMLIITVSGRRNLGITSTCTGINLRIGLTDYAMLPVGTGTNINVTGVRNISIYMFYLFESHINWPPTNTVSVRVSWSTGLNSERNAIRTFANVEQTGPLSTHDKISAYNGGTTLNCELSKSPITGLSSNQLAITGLATWSNDDLQTPSSTRSYGMLNNGCLTYNVNTNDNHAIFPGDTCLYGADSVMIQAEATSSSEPANMPVGGVMIVAIFNPYCVDRLRIYYGGISYLNPYETGYAYNLGANYVYLSYYECLGGTGTSYDLFIVYDTFCFHPDTLITTSEGEVNVANLKTGDLIKTLDGFKPLSRLMKTILNKSVTFTVFEADSLGPGIPSRETKLSRGHPVLFNDKYIADYKFGDSDSYPNVHFKDEKVEAFYHLQFDTHEVVYANGLPATTLPPLANKADSARNLPKESFIDQSLYNEDAIGIHEPPYTLHPNPPTDHLD